MVVLVENIGIISRLLKCKYFVNKLNIVLKSMIFILENRYHFFTNDVKLLKIVNIEYPLNENHFNDGYNYHICFKNTFFLLAKRSLCVQNSYSIFKSNSISTKIILSDGIINEISRHEKDIISKVLSSFLTQDKKKSLYMKNFRIICNSYLKIFLDNILSDVLPSEILDVILLYV